jgi:hypothetical protein
MPMWAFGDRQRAQQSIEPIRTLAVPLAYNRV